MLLEQTVLCQPYRVAEAAVFSVDVDTSLENRWRASDFVVVFLVTPNGKGAVWPSLQVPNRTNPDYWTLAFDERTAAFSALLQTCKLKDACFVRQLTEAVVLQAIVGAAVLADEPGDHAVDGDLVGSE